MSEKQPKKQDDLDMETTFADMNVDGMPWYNPKRKSGQKADKIQLTGAERWAMFKAGCAAVIPFVLGAAGLFLALYAIMVLWLK